MSFDYDLFVIGGGSGGVRAARIAGSEGGAKVALAEEYRVGGTCVIRGCVPKKLMVYASAFPDQIADAAGYGWQVSAPERFDWPKFRTTLEAELDRLETAYGSGLSSAGVEVFRARATVIDPHKVQLSDGRVFTAKHILIATGGWPQAPAFEGGELAVSSNEIFKLEALPRRVLIIGAGFIACEFACILKGLGAEVDLFVRGPQILRGFDDEARGLVAKGMAEKGIGMRFDTRVAKLEKTPDGLRATTLAGDVADYDLVLNATGRVPNSQGLGLEALGVAMGPKGAIVVDGYSQTSVPSIFAVGDVTNRVNLTPVAIREGHAFADTVFKGTPRQADHSLIPMAVFTQPELASAGMTEEQAVAEGAVEVYTTSFRPMQTLFAGRQDRTFYKLIVCAKTRRILGCHLVGPGAAELIQLVAVAMRMGATKDDFDRTMAVHPTASEELVTLRHPTRRH